MTLAAGTRLGRYEIRSPLGKGGMGEVYLAYDTQLERTIALKTLPPDVARDQQRMHRFIREAKATAALSHPNIAHIYEIGETEGTTFIAMEYVEGETLRHYLKRESPTPDEALNIALQVAGALSEAHAEGIVHRDIKPENIMLRPDGYVKLLDFGLAKLVERYEKGDQNSSDEAPTQLIQTNPGMLMGTVTYMSPEQARGLEVDGRTDIWSLGVILYEMIAGRVPFTGTTTTDMLVSILEHKPRPLRKLMPELPVDLERIVAKAMSKRRESRYKSAGEFVSAIKALRQEMEFKAKLARSLNVNLNSAEAETEYVARPAIPTVQEHSTPSKSSGRTSLAGRRRRPRSRAIDSLAILPFVNSSGATETEYFSDGITETIINNLSQLPKLKVMARSTIFRYKDKEVDPLEVGQELNVRAVLTGRVLHLGDKMVIQAELVDAFDGSRLWGDQYNRQWADVFAIQEEIAREISEKLRFKLTGEEQRQLTKRHTDNPEAYRLYLKGRYCWNKRTPEGSKKGIEYFRKAIDLDSGYALAYAGLADSYNVLGNYGDLPPRDAFPRAKTAATKALRIDETLAEARSALAYALNGYDWNWEAAAVEFKRAIELKPNYATAHYSYAITHLAALGKLDEAISEMMEAKELDPLSLIINTNLGWVLYFAGRYDEAIKQIHKALEIDENFNVAYFKLGQVYERLGKYDEAIELYLKAKQLSGGNLWINQGLGHACAMSGRRDEALRILDELKALSTKRYVSPYIFAEIYRGLGEIDLTFEWLEKAFEDRTDWLVWLGVEPALDPLRSDPRFKNLVQRIGLPTKQ